MSLQVFTANKVEHLYFTYFLTHTHTMDVFVLQRITFQFIIGRFFYFLFLSFETAQVELFSSDDDSCTSVYGLFTDRNLNISRESDVGCPGVFAFVVFQEQLQCNISNCKLKIYILTLYNISQIN